MRGFSGQRFLQTCFDHELCLWPRRKYFGVHREIQCPKMLATKNVTHWLASLAPFGQRIYGLYLRVANCAARISDDL